MTKLSEVFTKLRRGNKKQYALLFGCLFFSVLLITAYCLMMRSPTVLNVLPVGGDSRKQVMMVFVLAVIGCGAFCLYAAGLFLREKSREAGVFLALGASKKVVGVQLRGEVGSIALAACGLGMALGTPLAWLVWSIFRLTLADTAEMTLFFDYRAYGIALAFSVFVILALMFMLSRFIRRTNIIDIVSESHRAEPIKAVPRWYGWVGILLLIGGALLGYLTPSFCVRVLHWYAPEGLMSITYLPALVGLYMILLHTVQNGWKRGESRYKNLVATGMMQFQGRQTVRNMLVITVLVAGAYFSAFYVPMMATPAQLTFDAREADYVFAYRNDQQMITEDEIRQLAEDENVDITDYVSVPTATLGIDGNEQVETKASLGITYNIEYRPLLMSERFMSASSWNAITGEGLTLSHGEIATVFDAFGGGYTDDEARLITNPVTGETLDVTPAARLKSDILFSYRVLSDEDFARLTEGLPADWTETKVVFNVENCEASYEFSKKLYKEIIAHSTDAVAICGGYDRVVKQRCSDAGEIYFFDEPEKNGIPIINLDECDTSVFKTNWMYMPQFRVMDKENFLTDMAVWLLLFVFVAILCFAAVAVILYTRCMTIALTNAWVYDDLRHLGAPNAYLRGVVRGQVSRVFKAPIITGTLLILAFITMILFFNGGTEISAYEMASLKNCFVVVAVISCLIYGLYRFTLHKTCARLGI